MNFTEAIKKILECDKCCVFFEAGFSNNVMSTAFILSLKSSTKKNFTDTKTMQSMHLLVLAKHENDWCEPVFTSVSDQNPLYKSKNVLAFKAVDEETKKLLFIV